MYQVVGLHSEFDELQQIHGDSSLCAIYGAGKIQSPRFMFIFMNPTSKNIASNPQWNGLRAPWIGTKAVWKLFNGIGALDSALFSLTSTYKPEQWTVSFAQQVYENIEKHGIYVTNLAKCTQIDARPVANRVYHEYLDLMYQEIESVKPEKIVTFGNQVSSLVLQKPVRVSDYTGNAQETLSLGQKYQVYPTYYPVGQGLRNQAVAVARINSII